jgi:putative ABC transport system permease protein
VARGRGFAPGLYQWALRFLPPSVYAEDGEEMAAVFTDLWAQALGFRQKGRLALLAFGRLPWVVVMEWTERMGLVRSPGHDPNQRRWGMSSWRANLWLALRTLRKAPAFTVTTIILLGLGIGSVTTMFTVADHVFLRALPYPDQDRLFMVDNGSHSGPVWRELQNLNSVELWGAAYTRTANLVGEGDPLRVTATAVSRDFFNLFGARPAMGRLLVEEDFGAGDVVVLSHGIWKSVFGSDPDIIGRVIRSDDRDQSAPYQVVGVLGEEFVAPEGLADVGSEPDLWHPIDWSGEGFQRASLRVLDVMGRRVLGATLADVNGEMAVAAEALAKAWPEDRVNRDGEPVELSPLSLLEGTTRRVRLGLGLLVGAVSLLLLVACMNVAHLFLARGLGRVREMAVRRALGAGTGSLLQQLLVESLVLGTISCLLGSALASLGLRAFLSLNPRAIPWTSAVSLDVRTLLFAVAVSVVTVLLFGLVPALRSMGHDLTDDLKGTSRGSTSGRRMARMRSGLVVAEVALSLVLVAQAGLLLRSFIKVQAQDPGIQVAGVWTIPLTPSGLDSPEAYVQSMNEVEASLATIPGVQGAAYSFTLPLEMTGTGRCCWMSGTVRVDGEVRTGTRQFLQPVTENYFETLGVPLVAGRVWSQGEAQADPWPTVLSENNAVELFGSAERALNQIYEIGADEPSRHLVIGVARDTRFFGLDQDYEHFAFIPMEKLAFPISMAHMAVKVDREAPAGFARTLREAVWAAAPAMPVPTVRPMTEWLERSAAGRRFDSALFGSFGALALILAAAGLYGTLLYAVGQRRRELGVRMALGAARARVQKQVVSEGIVLAVLGCAVGLAATWGVGRFMESRLFGLESTDPSTIAGAVAVLLGAAILASWLPARRASRVDPMEVLREE